MAMVLLLLPALSPDATQRPTASGDLNGDI
jgi:hypothetical protein